MSREAGPEKRRLTRSVARIPASFAASDTHGIGHIKNMSQGGLFLRTDTLPKKGDQVSVVFYVPDSSKIEVSGTVRWTTAQLKNADEDKPGFGMQFGEQAEDYLLFYEQLLTR